jgi:hypothetical protein
MRTPSWRVDLADLHDGRGRKPLVRGGVEAFASAPFILQSVVYSLHSLVAHRQQPIIEVGRRSIHSANRIGFFRYRQLQRWSCVALSYGIGVEFDATIVSSSGSASAAAVSTEVALSGAPGPSGAELATT